MKNIKKKFELYDKKISTAFDVFLGYLVSSLTIGVIGNILCLVPSKNSSTISPDINNIALWIINILMAPSVFFIIYYVLKIVFINFPKDLFDSFAEFNNKVKKLEKNE